MPTRCQISLKIPEDLLARVDAIAIKERRSRNGQIVRIIEEWLDQKSPEAPAAAQVAA